MLEWRKSETPSTLGEVTYEPPPAQAATVVARTQPEVMHPVMITVSRDAAVSSEPSGVPWKNDGHFLTRRTSEPSQTRSSTWAQRESSVTSRSRGNLTGQRPIS